jgi:tetratricopeptide (TPR) repeat protein
MPLADSTSSQLPRSEETWQVARVRLPVWMEPDDQPPFRPWCVLGLRLPSRALLEDLTPEEAEPAADRIGERLIEVARVLGFLPGRLQVSEAGLADGLRRSLSRDGFPDLNIEWVESLPEMDEAADTLVRGLFEDDPGLLAGDGVTLDQVASFAEAAASLTRAEPWRHLGEMDRIQVEAPEWGLTRSACVLGWAGPERGILFIPEPRELTAKLLLGGIVAKEPWMVHCVASWMIPPHDLYLWEKHGLALAGEEDYPRVVTPADESRRPDSRLLGFFESVLRALAVTTEDEMDSGSWEKTVETGLGPVRLTLILPDLLHPPEPGWDDDLGDLSDEEWLDDEFLEDEEELVSTLAAADGTDGMAETEEEPPSSELEAQRLVYQAWEAIGRRRVALARQALALWPGCADAWMLLAEHERDPERAVSLYSRAVEEAGRTLPVLLDDCVGLDDWAGHETRPYLSARFGLAEALWQADRSEEAIAHFQELLRLDPKDSLGARNRLVDALLLLDRDGEAVRVLDAHPDEIRAHSVYSRTLLAFRREGDSPGARNCLTLALARNRFVPECLLADGIPPELPSPFLRPGDRSEAVLYAMASSGVWYSTPGAIDWLRERVSASPKAGSGKPGKNRKKKKGRR